MPDAGPRCRLQASILRRQRGESEGHCKYEYEAHDVLLEAYIAAVGDAGDALPHGPELRDESLRPGWVDFHFLGFLAHVSRLLASWTHESTRNMAEFGVLSSGLMWWYIPRRVIIGPAGNIVKSCVPG